MIRGVFSRFRDLPAKVADDFPIRAYLVFASVSAALELVKHADLLYPNPVSAWAGVLGLLFAVVHLFIASPLFILYVSANAKPKILLSVPLLILGYYALNVIQLQWTGGQDVPVWIDVGISTLIDVYVLALTAHVMFSTHR